MSKSIQKNIRTVVMAIIALFVILSFIFSILCMTFLSRKYQENMAETVIDFADAVIDADDAKDFLTTRNKNDVYNSVHKKLNDFQKKNSSFVNRISLINFSNSAGNYIYDTGGEELGNRLEYDRYIGSVKTELINGRNSWTARRKNILCVFQPLRTVEDKNAGYIIVELKEPFTEKYYIYAIIIYVFIILSGIIFVLILNAYMKQKLFRPMHSLIEATKHFTGEENKTLQQYNSDIFAENRDDEIGQLGKSIKKMFLDINNGVENLSRAIYDANHDGMTQTLNKRCYQNMEQMFKNCSSLCVIYFDVNNLKLMNDTLGHEKGDMVIKKAAEYIKSFLGQSDYCFRMGGDEFLMVMTDCTFRSIDSLIEKLESDAPFILNKHSDSVKCALSFGYAYAKGTFSYEELLAEAEENMYSKKMELKKLLNMPER
ncbi:MAG: GGDEF domain-containing protein [Ruminococcus sp.]|nr:GGDEF domain-containing protein [Ruminococcus sp.]MDE7138391.1 GGDEF domain-containing protein [Ruminococcus sp.]